MNKALRLVTILAVSSCWFVGGCSDRPPAPPRPSLFKRLKVLAVSADDITERRAVTAVETARVNYTFHLNVLKGYYERVGNMDKLTWARREMHNLQRAKRFQWRPAPAIVAPARESLEKADERLLVEHVVGARRNYQLAATKLLTYYERENRRFKTKVIRNMQKRLDPIRTYMYFLSAEIPSADLKTDHVISAADELYLKAWDLHQGGRGLILFRIWAKYPKQREALAILLELIEKYPRSTRAPMTAYFIAEIYKEYFDENLRAVNWYQRAWQWEPNISKPARFQAAVIHDLRLHNTEEALKCYRMVLQDETFDSGNLKFARERINALSKAAPTETPGPPPRSAPGISSGVAR